MLGFYIRHIKLIRQSGIFLPFKVGNKTRIKIKPTAKLQLKSRISIGNKKLPLLSAVSTNIYLDRGAILSCASGVSIGPGVNIILKSEAKLTIGANTYLTSDSHIEVQKLIEIGNDCAISWGVTIIDSDHHKIIKNQSSGQIVTEMVSIGNHVWIGCNSTILKGTIIGENSIVAAGSVVKGVFPPNSLIAGNPAKAVTESVNWE